MDMNEMIKLKGRKNGITIILDENAEFEDILDVFALRIDGAKNFFTGQKLAVSFAGRELSKEEKDVLLEILREKTVSEITESPAAPPQKPKAKPEPPEPVSAPFSPLLNMTIYHRGSLRSGQSINHDGSIVVMGDVNPGSELTARGNIIVLGSLKGFAHAGAGGDLSCYIAALNLIPTQIRIGDIITYIPQEKKSRIKQTFPTYAYVEGGKIYIAKM